jgi:hypothetical protein
MGRKRIHLTADQKSAATRQYNKTHYARQKGKMKVSRCTTCKSNFDTMLLQRESNKALLSLLSTHSTSTSFSWPDEVTELSIGQTVKQGLFPSGQIPPEIATDPVFIHSINHPMELRILTIAPHSLSPKVLQSIKGGEIPHDYSFHENAQLSNPGDGTTGLCIFETSAASPDFVFMAPSFVRNEDTAQMGIEEDVSIRSMATGARMGAASGYLMLPHDTTCFDPRSLSVATQNERALFRGDNHNSTAVSVDYITRRGRKRRWASTYRDMYMSRITTISKKQEALLSSCYRRLLIKEMLSRVRCLAAASLLQLTPLTLAQPWKKLEDAIDRRHSLASNKWHLCDRSLTCWEAILLEWACSTGEMRNHEACCTHQDGNKSHFMETMWLGGKSDPTDTSASTSKVRAMTNGKLVLPVEGLVIDIKCGHDFLHLGLKKTMHVPDNTRNHHNWSRVHGP